jgi:D-tyrosyl-tRNA(Tyr) deacylase
MRAVVQRVSAARVDIDAVTVEEFSGPGLLVLLGVTHADTAELAARLASKTYRLRIFGPEHAAKVGVEAAGAAREISAAELGLPVLVVSQFTLYGDATRGRRPTWSDAAPGEMAEPLVQSYVAALQGLGATVATGVFGAQMAVTSTNDGPFTILLEL